MQPIEFADILSTDLQLAHTGYLTHALCLEGTATLLFNGASFPHFRVRDSGMREVIVRAERDKNYCSYGRILWRFITVRSILFRGTGVERDP